MYGELTDKETIARIEECLEGQIHDQFEILLYKKNSKSSEHRVSCMRRFQCGVHGLFARIDGFRRRVCDWRLIRGPKQDDRITDNQK